MKIHVCLTPAEVAAADVNGAAVAVIDVLRATSTIVEALANGAKAVLPVATPEEATSLLQRLDSEDVLRCGERRGARIEGFDLGNSPQEFTADRVGGKLLAMTTTNGTPALLAAAGARRVVVASFLNLRAVTDALAGEERVVLLCAGREGSFALEDGLCAGTL
ncbi:MAG: 2-phosphosulfolactate phosphatase, partial [Longimicrobiales bacterium]